MSDKLLREVHYISNSEWDTIFGPVKDAIKAFGKTVTASAKLIGNDVAMIIKWNVRFNLNSLRKQEEMMNEWKTERGRHLDEIYKNQNAALESLGPDKYTAMLMCPGLFWSSAGRRGAQKILSKETLETIGEFGADKLPIIGGLFAASGARAYSSKGFWDELFPDELGDGTSQVDAWNDGVEALGDRIGAESDSLKWLLLDKLPDKNKGGFIKNLMHSINSIFLLDFSHHERSGQVLQEGDESVKIQIKDKLEFAEEMIQKAVEANMKDAYVDERKKYIEEHKKAFEPGITSTEKILQMNISLATEDDPDAFFKIIEDTAKSEPEFKELDPDNLKQEFQKMVEKLASDEEVMAQLREELEKSGDIEGLNEGDESSPLELTDKEKPIFEEKLKKIALDNCKGGFMNTLKEGVVDLYDKMVNRVTDGLQEKTMEEMYNSNDEISKAYIEQIKGFQKRLEDVVTNMK